MDLGSSLIIFWALDLYIVYSNFKSQKVRKKNFLNEKEKHKI